MKTNPMTVRRGWVLASIVAVALQLSPAMAGVPEPDTVIFGSIAFGGHGITAANTDVLVELRGAANGPVLSSYRMGDSARAGNRYVLRVKSESTAPLLEEDSLPIGATLYLTVRDDSGVLYERTQVLTARGSFVRIDFGDVDTDGDGMSDTFETTYFGNATGGNPNADPDVDGRPNFREALQGTNPLVADGQHPADIHPADWSLNIQEITEYALAWKLGTPWTIEPATIPADYVTRAAALWVGGENYVFDNVPVTTAPLWWTQAAASAPAAVADDASGEALAQSDATASSTESESETETLRKTLVTEARTGLAALRSTEESRRGAGLQSPRNTPVVQRVLPASYALNRAFKVSVTVEPGTGTRAFAVEEAPPAGWLVRFVSNEGRYDAKNKLIKWGPFYGEETRVLSYELTPLSAVANAAFAGKGSFDGTSYAAEGAAAISTGGSGGTVPPSITVLRSSSAPEGVALELTASPGASYTVEASEDFTSWTAVGSITTDDSGRAVFETAGLDSNRFFRLRAK